MGPGAALLGLRRGTQVDREFRMVVVVVSILLMLASLAGMAWTILSGSLLTVDGLFFTLILGAMFMIFAFNSLYELRALRARRASAQVAKSVPVTSPQAAAVTPSKPGAAPSAAAGTASPGQASAAAPAPAPTPQTLTTEAKPAPAAMPPTPAKPAESTAIEAPVLRRLRPVVELTSRPAPPPPPIEGLASGSVLVHEDAPLGDSIRLQPQTYGRAWKLVEAENATQLERSLRDAGQEIFFIVGEIEGRGLAFGRKQAVNQALEKVLVAVEAQGRNALEISRVRIMNVLGMHSVTVAVHARHIQESRFILAEKSKVAVAPQPVIGPTIGTEDDPFVTQAQHAEAGHGRDPAARAA
jgi:hypothetical protein